jgi:hypothetical protein
MQEQNTNVQLHMELESEIERSEQVEASIFKSATVLMHEDGRTASVEQYGDDYFKLYLYDCRYRYVHRDANKLERYTDYYDALQSGAEWVGIVPTEDTSD